MKKNLLHHLRKRIFAPPGPLCQENDDLSAAFFWRIAGLIVLFYLIFPLVLKYFVAELSPELLKKSFFLIVILPQLCLAAILFSIIYFTGRQFSLKKKLGMQNWQWGYIPNSIVLGFTMLIVNGIVTGILKAVMDSCGYQLRAPAIFNLFKNAAPSQITGLLVLVLIVAPVVEELIFRRFLYNYCAKCLGTLPAMIAVSLLFAIIHDSNLQMPGLFLLGIVFQMAYNATGSIYYPILLHFFNNLISVSIFFYTQYFI
tara:strand:- start:320 stop:1090 length:771 start_codon:yes stop_codon:yes gene_type:complete